MAIRNRNPRNFPINPIHTLLPNFERDFHKPFPHYDEHYKGGHRNGLNEFIHRQPFPIENGHGHGHSDGYNIKQSIPNERTGRFNPYKRPIDKRPIEKRPIENNSRYLAKRIEEQEIIAKLHQLRIEHAANEKKNADLAKKISNINKEILKLIEEQAKLIEEQSALRDKNTVLTDESKQLNDKLKSLKCQPRVPGIPGIPRIPPNSRGPVSSRISRVKTVPDDTTHANEPVDYSKPNSGSFVLKLSNFCKESSSDEDDVESTDDKDDTTTYVFDEE